MTVKTAVSRDPASFGLVYTYRELTYKVCYARLEKEPEDLDALFEELKQKAGEVEFVHDIPEMLRKLGIDESWVQSKVETFVMPETLNTCTRGIATKDGKEVRFLLEHP